MVNYALGKIYRITGNGCTYYGSTCEPTLARRLADHTGKYRKYRDRKGKKYVSSFKCFENGNTDYQITLLKLYPCHIKDELLMRESYYIENYECVNTNIPYRSAAEKTRAKVNEYLRVWQKTHYDPAKKRAYYLKKKAEKAAKAETTLI